MATVYYKMRQILLQNPTDILLQNATNVYYKMRQVFYYKMRRLLQNVRFITNCGSTFRLPKFAFVNLFKLVFHNST